MILAIPWLLGIPLIGAALAFVAGQRHAATIAASTMVLIVAATVPVVWLVWARGGFTLAIGGWTPPLGIALVGDGLSATLIATTTCVCVATGIYALAYVPRQHQAEQASAWMFWPLWLFVWAGMNAAFLAGDLFNLYIAIEVIGLSSVALVGLSGREALTAAVRYVLVTLTGSLLYLLGVALIYADYGLVDIAALATLVEARPPTRAALLVMTLGLALKTAIVPLHFWLAPAHARALAPISAVLSGLVVETTLYVLLRLWIGVLPQVIDAGLAEAIGLLGVLAVVWGSLRASVAGRLKLIAAYSTIAQLGYLLLAFPIAMHRPAGAPAWSGLALFIVAHALAKAAIFLAAGNVVHALGDDALDRLPGITNTMPVTALTLGLAGLALIGLPPSGVFISKWLLMSGAFATGRLGYVAVIAGGSLLAAAYVFPIVSASLRNPPLPAPPPPPTPVPMAMRYAPLALAVAGAILGLAAQPILELIGKADPFQAARVAQ